tara:strand:+ start:25 stop:816 length:792 start_codon:yes stop_codon:yes gene_type:complete
MISVVEVYNAVRDMANQDQKGFITPQVFNSFAAVAQRNVFAKIADKMVAAKNARMRGIDLSESDSVLVKYKNFMSNYEKSVNISQGQAISEESVFAAGDAVETEPIRKPADCYSVISVIDGDADTGFKNFELVHNTRDMARILRSNLSAPTAEFPVALISSNIEIFPDSAAVSDTIKLVYYREPSSRTIVSGTLPAGSIDKVGSPRISVIGQITDATAVDFGTSRNFDLPSDMVPELMEEIISMVGVTLRDPLLIKVAPKVVK